MELRYRGLGKEQFAPLFKLGDDELGARGIRRVIADEKPGYPCRITLEDAEPGESVLLLPFEHHPANSPYRASGPIFVRESAQGTFDRAGAPPSVFQGRLLSARAYGQDGMMLDAEVCENRDIVPLLQRFLDNAQVGYVHVHFARRGCFAARVERA